MCSYKILRKLSKNLICSNGISFSWKMCYNEILDKISWKIWSVFIIFFPPGKLHAFLRNFKKALLEIWNGILILSCWSRSDRKKVEIISIFLWIILDRSGQVLDYLIQSIPRKWKTVFKELLPGLEIHERKKMCLWTQYELGNYLKFKFNYMTFRKNLGEGIAGTYWRIVKPLWRTTFLH